MNLLICLLISHTCTDISLVHRVHLYYIFILILRRESQSQSELLRRHRNLGSRLIWVTAMADARGAPGAPLYGPKFSQFHAAFRKIWRNCLLTPLPWRVGAPLLQGILYRAISVPFQWSEGKHLLNNC